MPAIIRVLWGETGPESRFGKVWSKDVWARLVEPWTCPQWVYVYGKHNADELTKRKIENLNVVLVDPEPFPDGRRDFHREDGEIIRPWHYKLWLQKEALKDHGAIMYCDWDVRCFVEHVEIPFSMMGDRSISLSAYMYKRPRFPDRETKRAKRFSPSGNWMYMSDSNFIDRILFRMNKGEKWDWHDELVMGRYLDEKHKGWMGEDVWLRQYESPVMCQRDNRCPWPLMGSQGKVVQRKTPVPFMWWRYFSQ